MFVADTDNHVIRKVERDGTTSTLAGHVAFSGEEPGCPRPCMKGQRGYRDGNLTHAEFYFPAAVAIGRSDTVLVLDGHRVRRVNRLNIPSTIQGVTSVNRVVTLAGGMAHGEMDDIGSLATFNSPKGLAMAADGRIYIADTTNCRIRRISSARDVARVVQCEDKATDVMRPSGCASYDPPTDSIFSKATPRADDVDYNYHRNDSWRVKNCLGTPPLSEGTGSANTPIAPREGTLMVAIDIVEDTGSATAYRLRCPPGCAGEASGTL